MIPEKKIELHQKGVGGEDMENTWPVDGDRLLST